MVEAKTVARFHALADPTRLRIVAALAQQPRCVCEVQAVLAPIAANLLSYHLAVLRAAGLVSVRRRGRWVDYRLEYAAFEPLVACLPRTPAAEPAGRHTLDAPAPLAKARRRRARADVPGTGPPSGRASDEPPSRSEPPSAASACGRRDSGIR